MEGHPPPETAPHHPRGTQLPAEHASQGDSAGPPHPHTCAHNTWVANPGSPPGGRATGGGNEPELRRPPLTTAKGTPPGMTSCHPHSAQQRLARAHAEGPVLGPHAHTNRTRDTRVAEPRLPTPQDGQPGEGQRVTPDAPHNGGGPQPPQDGVPPPSRRADPHGARKSRAQCWALAPALPRQPPGSRGGRRPESGRPSQRRQGPWVPKPTPTAPGTHGVQNPGRQPLKRRAAGGGTAPDARRPSQRWKATPPGDGPPPPQPHAAPRGTCKPREQCWAPTHSTLVAGLGRDSA